MKSGRSVTTYGAPAAVVIGVAALSPFAYRSDGLADSSLLIATNALIALSIGMCLGLGGLFTMAQATFATIGAYATAIATVRWELSPWLGLILALLVPALLSFLVALVIVRLSPLVLALATLMLAEIFVALIQNGGDDFTGGYLGISGIPSPAGLDNLFTAQLIAWGAVALVCLGLAHVARSQQGRAIRTIAHDPILARSLGISVTMRLSVLFGMAGAVAGLAGWLYAHSRIYLAPESLPPSLSFTAIIMVLLGGSRTVIGPVLGAVLVTMLDHELPGGAYDGLFYGAAIIVVMLILPRGLAGTPWLDLVRQRWKPSNPAPAPASTPPAKVGSR